MLRWSYKHSREIARRMACYRGECLEQHPVFPEGSQAICNENAKPADMHAPEIKYTEEDDKAIDDFTRRIVGTSWHSVHPFPIYVSYNLSSPTPSLDLALQLGTCAMKPRDQAGVVDSSLNVYGVTGLKVAGGWWPLLLSRLDGLSFRQTCPLLPQMLVP